MNREPRIIPILLVAGRRCVKTVGFRKPRYIGDPLNIAKLFNDKEVDELIVLDIDNDGSLGPDFDLASRVASECFMPVCFGGGIRSLADAKRLVSLGIEKIALRRIAFDSPETLKAIAAELGSQSVVASLDVSRSFWSGTRVEVGLGRAQRCDPVRAVELLNDCGVGEVLLTSVEREGRMSGYDLNLISEVSSATSIPIIAHGGARSLEDMALAIRAGAAAAGAGSMFVFHGPRRGVLVSYPSRDEIRTTFDQNG